MQSFPPSFRAFGNFLLGCHCSKVKKTCFKCPNHVFVPKTGLNDSQLRKLIRYYTMKKWRKAVRKRDGCCVRCGGTEELSVHHERYAVEMTMEEMHTLCGRCHRAEHGFNPPGTRSRRKLHDASHGSLKAAEG